MHIPVIVLEYYISMEHSIPEKLKKVRAIRSELRRLHKMQSKICKQNDFEDQNVDKENIVLPGKKELLEIKLPNVHY